MKRFIGIVVLLLTSSTFIQAQDKEEEKKKDYSEAVTFAEVWLEAQKDYEKLPGISVAMVEDQEILYKGAFGHSNIAENEEAQTNTIYSVCSISKLFTSVAIMNLYEEGKIRLDDEIADLVPWFTIKQAYEGSGPITIRSLLTHSSGLPRENFFSHWNADYEFPTKEQILEKLEDQETLYPASTYFQYSNLAMALLGFVIEEVSGSSYEMYVDQNILGPLNMEDTRSYMPENLYGDQLAIGYTSLNRAGERKQAEFFDGNGVDPAAGFSSTVEDLATFASWQFRLYENEKEEILKPSTLKNMHNIHWMDSDFGTSWGLGFSVFKGPDGKKWVGHGGSCPGFRSTLRIDPNKKEAFTAMVNAQGVNPTKYANGIYSLFSKVKSGKVDSLEAELSEYAGIYAFDGWGETYYGVWEGKLAAMGLPTNSPGDALSMFKMKEKDLFVRIRDNGEEGETLEFLRDDDGNITYARVHKSYLSKRQN